MESFWCHSAGCGLAARILGSWRREPNCEQHLVAGLLHDIGRLILLLKRGDDMAAAIDAAKLADRLLYQCEQEPLGFDHTAVGGELLKHWNLPPHICAAVAFHHTPQRAGTHKQAAAIVHIADILVNGIACVSSGEHYVPPPDPESWRTLDLSTSVVGTTLNLLSRQLTDTLTMLVGDEQ